MPVNAPLQWLGRVVATALAASVLAARADDVVAHYHFAGSDELSGQPNFAAQTKILGLDTSISFKNLVVRRFADYLASGLPGNTPTPGAPLQPLIVESLSAESVASFGGAQGGPLQFVLALRIDSQHAQAWDENLTKACQRPGEPLTLSGAHGLAWTDGPKSLWLLHTGDWLLVGRGSGLQSVRDDFLAHIQKQGRPAPALTSNFFEGDIDWAKLGQWLPISFGALKPARTIVEMTATHDQIIRLNARVIYPEPIQWSPQPWNLPTKLISDPLIDFTAARDIAPFLKDDVFAGVSDDPFPQQFFSWAMASMPFQNYVAWPVADATNEVKRLSTELPAAFGAKIKALDDGTFHWDAKRNQITWVSPALRLSAPILSPSHSGSQSYLFAGMFPAGGKITPPPPELFEQFLHRDDIVYYDWETTGRRLDDWRILSEMLPIIHRMTRDEAVAERGMMRAATNATQGAHYKPSYVVADNWLGNLAQHVQGDTTTVITKTGPAELTIKRRAPFLFTGLELELLTHWMTHAPSVGHIDPHAIPPRAKVTGPGIPSH